MQPAVQFLFYSHVKSNLLYLKKTGNKAIQTKLEKLRDLIKNSICDLFEQMSFIRQSLEFLCT